MEYRKHGIRSPFRLKSFSYNIVRSFFSLNMDFFFSLNMYENWMCMKIIYCCVWLLRKCISKLEPSMKTIHWIMSFGFLWNEIGRSKVTLSEFVAINSYIYHPLVTRTAGSKLTPMMYRYAFDNLWSLGEDWWNLNHSIPPPALTVPYLLWSFGFIIRFFCSCGI